MIYLAGPINGLNDDDASTWREQVKAVVGAENCLDPMRRDYRGKEDLHVNEIVSGDLDDINNSEVILANCWTPSFGTAMELWYAHSQNIPIIAVTPEPVSPWLRYVSFEIVDNLENGIIKALAIAHN